MKIKIGVVDYGFKELVKKVDLEQFNFKCIRDSLTFILDKSMAPGAKFAVTWNGILAEILVNIRGSADKLDIYRRSILSLLAENKINMFLRNTGIPAKISLHGVVFKIIERSILSDPNTGEPNSAFLGTADTYTTEIGIKKTTCGSQRVLTFWHEIVHLLDNFYENDELLSEVEIDLFAAALIQVLRDNPQLENSKAFEKWRSGKS